MTASLSATVTAEEIIAFVRSRPEGVTSHQAAEHFRVGWNKAASRLSKLHSYGKLNRRFVKVKEDYGHRGCANYRIAVYT